MTYEQAKGERPTTLEGMLEQRFWIQAGRHGLGAGVLETWAAVAKVAREFLEKRPWICFHCGFETTDQTAALGHFGEMGEEAPLCVVWGRFSDQDKLQDYQQLSIELNAERDENHRLRAQVEGLEFRVEGQLSEIHSFKPFRQCSSVREIFQVYDSMEGRALAAEERAAVAEVDAARLLALLNTPEVEEFDKAIPLEAAHQVQRWSADHDSGKGPEDWFWLIGYLAGKVLHSTKSGDVVKAKHHCVSTAAALRNWHAHLRSGVSLMRPGIEPPKPELGAQP